MLLALSFGSPRYAAILRRNGLQHGHLVCNTLPNSPQRLLTDMGVQMAGGVAMNGQLFLADGKDFLGSLREAACFAVILDPREPRGAARVLEHTEHTTHGKQVRTIRMMWTFNKNVLISYTSFHAVFARIRVRKSLPRLHADFNSVCI